MISFTRVLLLFFIIFLSESTFAAKKILNPFDLSAQIQNIFKLKKYNELQNILSSQAKITEQQFTDFYINPASSEFNSGATLSQLIINADHTYIQSGRPKNGEISGVIYFITRPKIKRRKVWLIDYAACAFKTHNGKLLLVEGFCFLGTDGASELEPVET